MVWNPSSVGNCFINAFCFVLLLRICLVSSFLHINLVVCFYCTAHWVALNLKLNPELNPNLKVNPPQWACRAVNAPKSPKGTAAQTKFLCMYNAYESVRMYVYLMQWAGSCCSVLPIITIISICFKGLAHCFHIFLPLHFFWQLRGNRWLSPTPAHSKTCHIWQVVLHCLRSLLLHADHKFPSWLSVSLLLLLIGVCWFRVSAFFFFLTDNIILKPIKAKFMRAPNWAAIIGHFGHFGIPNPVLDSVAGMLTAQSKHFLVLGIFLGCIS